MHLWKPKKNYPMSVRVRFAPSPTGPLHIGGVRTALYNYLFAKKYNGKFLLRIEDTDQNRFVPGAEQYIIESLRWCGIQWDEGPDNGGPYGPYRQSERKGIYRDYVEQLLAEGNAYYAFDTPQELDEMRKRLEADKSTNPQYDSNTRLHMNNSLTMTEEEVKEKLHAGTPYVVRIKIPDAEEVIVQDLIRGNVSVDSKLLDDKVLFKSDGMPTYHLANVVDDHKMQITHVIRGEEWLPSAPLHVLLYRFLGWEEKMPAFAHLPLLLKPDGHGKLSKRDGERLGFPVFPLEWNDPDTGETSRGYREDGYFPEAFANMLALLGWNPGTAQEVFSMQELTEAFSLERVGKAGARFDPDKASWFNHRYLQEKPLEEIAMLLLQIIQEKGHKADIETAKKIAALIRERANFIHELWEQAAFFFEPPSEYDQQFVKKMWKSETPELLSLLSQQLQQTEPFNLKGIEEGLHRFGEAQGVQPGKVMPGLRLALVGAGRGPDVKEIMALLGKEETISRIDKAVKTL